jgi:glycosyltransferase involved in cell wall biosynthesis
MATYNGARFVADQLRSILCQLQDDDEVIVSDDGSTDETLTIIRAFADPRIKILERAGSGRPADNFGYALAHAHHDIIFLSDQDDVWFEHKVLTMTHLLQTSDLVVTDCTLINAEGRETAPSFFQQHGSRPGFWANLVKNSYLGCCMAFRRSLLEKALPIPFNVPMHDIWLGMLAEWYGRPCFHPEPLVAYRRHDAASSTTAARSRSSLLQKIRFRYRLMLCLGQRIVRHRLVAQ